MGFCYLCSGPLSGIEGLSGRRKGLLKECREGGNTLSPAACGKLLPMRRHAFAYDPFSSERKTRCGGILVLCRWSVCLLEMEEQVLQRMGVNSTGPRTKIS